jgi:ABC-type multidrug transport system ATPase subunit
LYDVTDGRVLVDGHDVREVARTSLNHQVSVVSQEPFLFSGTIRENIRYNRAEASDEEIERAGRAVGAHGFISRLEHGYDTSLAERGGNLSIGQRQLISFARALAADPRILILDEATANIDTYTEMLIQKALDELLRDRTAIVIAHRLSTIRNADRIVVLDEGRVVEEGRHADLLEIEGLYYRLHSYSTEGEELDRAAASTNGAAGPESPAGAWKMTLESPRGTREGTLELVVDGSSLSGTWSGERGTQQFAGGTVEGSHLSWEVQMSGPMGQMSLRFSGLLADGVISGEVEFGSFGKGKFEATRAEAVQEADSAIIPPA